MTRKPIAIEIAMPSGPAHYWAAMKAAGKKGFTVRSIALSSGGVAYETVKRYVWFCVRHGHVVKIGAKKDGYATQVVYAVKTPLTMAPVERKGEKRLTARQAMWNAMRTLHQFSARELQANATTEERPISLRSVELYIQKLVAAGVLSVLEEASRASGKSKTGTPRGAAPGRYALKPSANTGPQAPVLCKADFVFDMNTRKPLGETKVSEHRL
jgi:hypothetical protein